MIVQVRMKTMSKYKTTDVRPWILAMCETRGEEEMSQMAIVRKLNTKETLHI